MDDVGRISGERHAGGATRRRAASRCSGNLRAGDATANAPSAPCEARSTSPANASPDIWPMRCPSLSGKDPHHRDLITRQRQQGEHSAALKTIDRQTLP